MDCLLPLIALFAMAAPFMCALSKLAENVAEAYQERRNLIHDKRMTAHDEVLAARYKSLGVNCHGHCYLFGCKYERITDELHALGYQQDVIERIVETFNRVPRREPCDCGKALLPVLKDTRAAGQVTLPPPNERKS